MRAVRCRSFVSMRAKQCAERTAAIVIAAAACTQQRGGLLNRVGFSLTANANRCAKNAYIAHAQLQSHTKKFACCAGRWPAEPVLAFFGNRDPDLTVAKLQV
jgi:hypothetical protein